MDTRKHTESAVSAGLRLSAAAGLQRYEVSTASLSVEECARRIDRHDWTVKYGEVNDVWTSWPIG